MSFQESEGSGFLVRGDDIYLTIGLEMSSSPFNVSGATSVTAVITDMQGRKIGNTLTLSPSTPGSNWSLGLVVLDLPRSLTAVLPDMIVFEVQAVIDNRRTTWRTGQIFVEKRAINN